MDFFAEQDKSRKNTGRLVFLFVLAVILIIIAVYAVINFTVYCYNTTYDPEFYDSEIKWIDSRIFLWVFLGTLSVIILSSMLKIISLAKGGSSIAESLGGRLINTSTDNPDERRLMNVVEEMAIASGVPVPMVYILDGEEGINAFAAGHNPNDAVVAVTKGCSSLLNRDELQGVVAHEFSHILNGDMGLNIRLIGILYGIMAIANIGYFILRSGSRSRRGGLQLFILGGLLFLVGYIGHFFGRLIQCAVSRQREYLADSSAVQFTRNPTGIAGALKKIGGFSLGANITSPLAGETCHMFFGKAIHSMFATHPDLIDRIQRIEPGFDGKFKKVTPVLSKQKSAWQPARSKDENSHIPHVSQLSVNVDKVADMPGHVTAEHISCSSEILASIPVSLKEELNNILGASAVVCALLLDKDIEERERQIRALKRIAPSEFIRHISIVEKKLKGIEPRLFLPLTDLAFPTLRLMPPIMYAKMQSYIDVLIEADGKLTLFEFSLKNVISHRLGSVFRKGKEKIRYYSIEPLLPDLSIFLSKLAHVGHEEKSQAKKAFYAAIVNLPIDVEKCEFLSEDKTTFPKLEKALNSFVVSSPGVKRLIINVCAHCILFDQMISMEEAELLRAIAYTMDIPLPPFLIGASTKKEDGEVRRIFHSSLIL